MSTEIVVLESGIPGWGRIAQAFRARFARRNRARSRRAVASSRAQDEVSRQIVAAGSVVRLFDLDALREATVVLAPSGKARSGGGFVSVDSSLGTALLGRRAGETIRLGPRQAPRRVQVVDVRGRLGPWAWEPLAEQRSPRHRVGDGALGRRTSDVSSLADAEALPAAA